MKVFDPSKRAVNPVLLAMQTGITKGGRKLHATPFNGLNGMGIPYGLHGSTVGTIANFDPEPISHAALNLIGAISSVFGIHSGSSEADVIVPIQNQLVSTVIAPISDALTLHGPDMTYETLQSLWNSLETAKQKWLNFLHQQWSDGRAAKQAESGLQPYFSDLETKIQGFLQTASHGAAGGLVNGVVTSPGPGITGILGSISPTMILIGAGILFLVMSSNKKGV